MYTKAYACTGGMGLVNTDFDQHHICNTSNNDIFQEHGFPCAKVSTPLFHSIKPFLYSYVKNENCQKEVIDRKIELQGFQSTLYFSLQGVTILLCLINSIKGSVISSKNAQDRQIHLKKTTLNPLLDGQHSVVDPDNFMPNYRLFHLRQALTSGSILGVTHLLVSLAFAYLSIFGFQAIPHGQLAQQHDLGTCAEVEPYLSNDVILTHFTMTRILCYIMLSFFAIIFLIKIVALISFGVCPLFQMKVRKKLHGEGPKVPDE